MSVKVAYKVPEFFYQTLSPGKKVLSMEQASDLSGFIEEYGQHPDSVVIACSSYRGVFAFRTNFLKRGPGIRAAFMTMDYELCWAFLADDEEQTFGPEDILLYLEDARTAGVLDQMPEDGERSES